jgi:hypothetical protein
MRGGDVIGGPDSPQYWKAYRTRRYERGSGWEEVRAHAKPRHSRSRRTLRQDLSDDASQSGDEELASRPQRARTEVPEFRGYLYKKGQLNTVYQRRYFVLSRGVLEWFSPSQVSYKGSTTGPPKGWISCAGATFEGNVGLQDGRFVFSVTAGEGTTSRRILLACETRGEMDEWAHALEVHSTCKPDTDDAVAASSVSVDDTSRKRIGRHVQEKKASSEASASTSLLKPDRGELTFFLREAQQQEGGDARGSWKPFRKLIFGIGPACDSYPESRLIFPGSPFAVGWMTLTATCLLYTALVTPAAIAFHWLDDECIFVPTLFVDLFVDIFFLCDIAVAFSLGVVHGDQYVDDFKWVARNYIVSGGLAFDLVTSIPVFFWCILNIFLWCLLQLKLACAPHTRTHTHIHTHTHGFLSWPARCSRATR